jgi:prolyl-tRNA editing enzyme YbaK/EbsC (Cys-tRNA(Pro) deacylase)
MADEVDLSRLYSLGRCRFFAPRIGDDNDLEIREYRPDKLDRHAFGFSQPTTDSATVDLADLDVVLVPGRAFDRLGRRLGRGGGYYDRFLATVPRGVVLVGVGTDSSTVAEVPADDSDMRVDWLATESGVVRVGQELQESTERFVDAAVATGIAAAPIRFPEGTKTSVDAANAIGCDLGAIAKSLVFLVDEQPVLVICSGDRRVDEHKLAALFGGSKAKAAPLSRVREISGYAGGGTPAVGHTTPMPAVVDPSLGRYRWVWSAGGTPETVYPVALERLVAATGAQIASVSMEV